MIKNIIFDWSGTLSNDIVQVYKATMKIFEKFNIKKISFKEFKQEFDLPILNFYKKYAPNINLEKAGEIFKKVIHEVGEPSPFPKAEEVLTFLKEKKIKLILLSSHPHQKILKEVKNYSFEKFFGNIHGGVFNKVKTIHNIMKQNEFLPTETIYVGDMVHDIEAANEVGIKVIAVTYGYTSRDKLEKENPDFVIDKIEDIKKLIEKNEK